MAGPGKVRWLRILSDPVRIEYADGSAETVERFFTPTLVRLALTAGTAVTAEQLEHETQNPQAQSNMVSVAISKIRGLGLKVLHRDGRYTLDLAVELVDAHQFMADVPKVIGQDWQPAHVDQLLALWGTDRRRRHTRIPSATWRTLYRRRDDLIRWLVGRPRDDLRSLARLDDFLAAFPDDPAADRLRQACDRMLVLLVEDLHPEKFEELLGEYEFATFRSYRDWQDSAWQGQPAYDIALVDLHLTPEMNDSHGLKVLSDLRRYSVPAILMSAGPPPGGDMDANKDKYGFHRWFSKEPTNEELLLTIRQVLDQPGRPGVERKS